MSAFDRAEDADDVPWWAKVLVIVGYGTAWALIIIFAWWVCKVLHLAE